MRRKKIKKPEKIRLQLLRSTVYATLNMQLKTREANQYMKYTESHVCYRTSQHVLMIVHQSVLLFVNVPFACVFLGFFTLQLMSRRAALCYLRAASGTPKNVNKCSAEAMISIAQLQTHSLPRAQTVNVQE